MFEINNNYRTWCTRYEYVVFDICRDGTVLYIDADWSHCKSFPYIKAQKTIELCYVGVIQFKAERTIAHLTISGFFL